jgi:hypothetical protein
MATFLQDFLQIFCMLFFLMRATCPAHLILFDLAILITPREDKHSSYEAPHYAVSSSLLLFNPSWALIVVLITVFLDVMH